MNIGEFTSLDREAQFKEAARIAGTSGVTVAGSVFDGIWRTESGRGANMRSSAGAEGHFQIMPKTRKVMESRFGTSINPDDFGQSLFTAAHLLAENLRQFKNVPDALRAYNGGWDKKRWGNPETAAYAGKVLGSDLQEETQHDASTAQAAEGIGMAITGAEKLWDAPYSRSQREPAQRKSPISSAAATALQLGAPAGEVIPATFGTSTQADEARSKEQKDKVKLAESTGFWDKVKAAGYDTLPVAILQRATRDPEPVDPNFQMNEEMFKGFDEREQRDLATATSQKQYDRMKFEIEYGREQQDIVMRSGFMTGLAASFIAASPEGMLTGGIATLAFRGAGFGSIQLAKAGQRNAALGSSLVEGVVGNTVNTIALDMLGKRQGVEAYALGAAGGILNPMLQGRYLGREATRFNEAQEAVRVLEAAAAREAVHVEAALKRLPPDHTPEDLQKMVETVEAEGIRADIASHKAAIPEERKLNVGQEDEAADIKVAEAAKAPEAPTANMETNDVSNLLQGLADEVGIGRVKPAYESPDYQAKRVENVVQNEQWAKNFATLTGGMYYRMAQALPPGVHMTADLQATISTNAQARETVKAMTDLASEYMPKGHRIVLGSQVATKGTGGQIFTAGEVHAIGLDFDTVKGNRTKGNHYGFHELGHAIYHAWAPTAPKELLARIDADWEAFVAKAAAGDKSARGDRFAITHPQRFEESAMKTSAYALNRDEYMAEQFIMHLQNRLMAGSYGKLSKGTIAQVVDGVKAVLNYVLDLVNLGKIKPGKATDEFFNQVLKDGFEASRKADEFLAPELRLPDMDAMADMADVPPALAKEIQDILNDPVALRHGLDRLPLNTNAERAEAKQMIALYKKAESPEYAVDSKRLSKLLNQVDSLNPTSNAMLRSKNPVVRMAAIELVENGGGAAGRRSTASIAKWMNERAIVGDSIVTLDREFRGWFKKQPGASNMKEAFNGTERSRFSRLVAEEIEQRRGGQQATDYGDNVRAAADSMEASFERARLMQVDAKTNGWSGLPPTSKGYLPHRIKSSTYRNLSLAQKKALHAELTDQFITTSEFDPTFADQLASRYLDRVEQRALGGFDSPMGLHQTGAADVIEDALKAMNLNPEEVKAMMKRHTAGAAGFTKKRLNLDLSKQVTLDDGTSFRLMDVYDTDMLSLMRSQSQRVAGEVALTRHGVYGKPGLALLRRAMAYGGDGEQAVLKEINAFDQISSEFLGSPIGTNNKWVDRAVQFNSVSSLGGMGFNQLGESINIAATLGVKAALQHISGFARLRSEILAKTKGMKVDNDLLDTMEIMGGAEFGTDAYKMVFPLDNPDLFANSLGQDSIGAGDKLLRGAGHLQSKLSLWRTIHSTQVRAVSEQIVLKAAKALKTGKNDFHLRDMGMDDDMLNRLRKDIDQIAKMKDGKITGFDITKAADKEAAHAFIQAVHRGGSQIIQGTFIGESGAYVHNSWLRMLTQFRSFSLTAIDKQWNRQVGNRGLSGAVMMTLAAMSAAAPIYMVRTYAASLGRADQDEYLEKHLSFGSIARATTNYIATSGLAGDFLDAGSALTGTGEMTGGRSGATSTLTGNLLAPAAGKVDKLWGAVQNTKEGTDPHALIKQLPLSRLPFVIPLINSLGD